MSAPTEIGQLDVAALMNEKVLGLEVDVRHAPLVHVPANGAKSGGGSDWLGCACVWRVSQGKVKVCFGMILG